MYLGKPDPDVDTHLKAIEWLRNKKKAAVYHDDMQQIERLIGYHKRELKRLYNEVPE